MRIRSAAAGPEYDLRIRGTAGRDPGQDYTTSLRPEDEARFQYAQSTPQTHSWSRSSTRVRSISASEQQSLKDSVTEHTLQLQTKEQHIVEQEETISHLKAEKQALAEKVKHLTQTEHNLTRQLKEKGEEVQRLSQGDPELTRRKHEFIASQTRKLHSFNSYVKDLQEQIQTLGKVPVHPAVDNSAEPASTQDLQGIEAPEDYVDSEDELRALDYASDFGHFKKDMVTPVERRIQAFGPTMDDNDRMESQQQVIVSKHLRNAKDGAWANPVAQTVYWAKVNSDPVFAGVGDGPTITFDVLHNRMKDTSASHTLQADYQYLSEGEAVGDDEYGDQRYPPQASADNYISSGREERLRDNRSPMLHTSKNARGRSRSRSPAFATAADQRPMYRRRKYESYRPGASPTLRERARYREDNDAERSKATFDGGRSRNEPSLNYRPPPQGKPKKRGGKGRRRDRRRDSDLKYQQLHMSSERRDKVQHR